MEVDRCRPRSRFGDDALGQSDGREAGGLSGLVVALVDERGVAPDRGADGADHVDEQTVGEVEP